MRPSELRALINRDTFTSESQIIESAPSLLVLWEAVARYLEAHDASAFRTSSCSIGCVDALACADCGAINHVSADSETTPSIVGYTCRHGKESDEACEIEDGSGVGEAP
jgi:hypothetical protein